MSPSSTEACGFDMNAAALVLKKTSTSARFSGSATSGRSSSDSMVRVASRPLSAPSSAPIAGPSSASSVGKSAPSMRPVSTPTSTASSSPVDRLDRMMMRISRPATRSSVVRACASISSSSCSAPGGVAAHELALGQREVRAMGRLVRLVPGARAEQVEAAPQKLEGGGVGARARDLEAGPQVEAREPAALAGVVTNGAPRFIWRTTSNRRLVAAARRRSSASNDGRSARASLPRSPASSSS